MPPFNEPMVEIHTPADDHLVTLLTNEIKSLQRIIEECQRLQREMSEQRDLLQRSGTGSKPERNVSSRLSVVSPTSGSDQ